MFATNFNYQDNYVCESGMKDIAVKAYTSINTFHFVFKLRNGC